MTGPFERLDVGGGVKADLWILRFGEDGELLSRDAEQALKQRIGRATRIFLFAHGWNNDFDDALARYRHFVAGYAGQGDGPDKGAEPVMIGVVWPSTSFLFPWEDGPEVAGGDGSGQTEEMLRYVTADLDAAGTARVTQLVDGRTAVTAAEAGPAVAALREVLLGEDPDLGGAPQVPEVLRSWQAGEAGGSLARITGDVGDILDAAAGGADPRALQGGPVVDPRPAAGPPGSRRPGQQGLDQLPEPVLDQPLLLRRAHERRRSPISS